MFYFKTDLADVRSLAGVFLHPVDLPVSLLVELCAAVRALPGFALAVQDGVFVEVPAGGEGLLADVTLVDGARCVDPGSASGFGSLSFLERGMTIRLCDLYYQMVHSYMARLLFEHLLRVIGDSLLRLLENDLY